MIVQYVHIVSLCNQHFNFCGIKTLDIKALLPTHAEDSCPACPQVMLQAFIKTEKVVSTLIKATGTCGGCLFFTPLRQTR